MQQYGDEQYYDEEDDDKRQLNASDPYKDLSGFGDEDGSSNDRSPERSSQKHLTP